MKLSRKWLFIGYLLLCLTAAAHAQRSEQERPRSERMGGFPLNHQQFVHFEAINLPSEDSSLSRVDIIYRIGNRFFVFVRSDVSSVGPDTLQESLAQQPFIARAEVSVELLNPSGRSAARQIARKTIHTDEPDSPLAKVRSLEGVFSFSVEPGEYQIVFGVLDLESTRQFLDKEKKIRLRDFRKETLAISDPVFLQPRSGNQEDRLYSAVNLGGDIPFGSSVDAFFSVSYRTAPGLIPQVSCSAYRFNNDGQDSTFYMRDSVLSVAADTPRTLDTIGGPTTFFYRLVESTRPGIASVVFTLNSERFLQGRYELRITASVNGLQQTHVQPFSVRWVNMPMSLADLDLSIEALDYITSKEELGDIKAYSESKRRLRFEEFWKRRDPTPGTAFNEAMAEYYRRVDEAMRLFSTIKNPNGFRTDRGKIYILYGEPTRTERKLLPRTPPTEVWTFENVKKRFVFVDENRDGTYKLSHTESLQ